MSLVAKYQLFFPFAFRILSKAIIDIFKHYFSLFPILMFIGVLKRIKRRFKFIFLPKGRGRPPVSEEIIDLIISMKMSNLSWGALRISQELKLLGISIHKKTVQRILKDNGIVPPDNYRTVTWKSFFNSLKYSWALDFTTVFDASGFQLYILNVINQNTRELVLTNCTYHPSRSWLTQQFKNIAIEGSHFPKSLVVDNDGIFGKWLVPVFKNYFGISVKKIPPKSPNFNPFIERFHRTMKDEILNQIHIVNDHQVRPILQEYKKYYNQIRPHQGINGKIPCGALDNKLSINISNKKFKKVSHLDGLITSFSVAA